MPSSLEEAVRRATFFAAVSVWTTVRRENVHALADGRLVAYLEHEWEGGTRVVSRDGVFFEVQQAHYRPLNPNGDTWHTCLEITVLVAHHNHEAQE